MKRLLRRPNTIRYLFAQFVTDAGALLRALLNLPDVVLQPFDLVEQLLLPLPVLLHGHVAHLVAEAPENKEKKVYESRAPSDIPRSHPRIKTSIPFPSSNPPERAVCLLKFLVRAGEPGLQLRYLALDAVVVSPLAADSFLVRMRLLSRAAAAVDRAQRRQLLVVAVRHLLQPPDLGQNGVDLVGRGGLGRGSAAAATGAGVHVASGSSGQRRGRARRRHRLLLLLRLLAGEVLLLQEVGFRITLKNKAKLDDDKFLRFLRDFLLV